MSKYFLERLEQYKKGNLYEIGKHRLIVGDATMEDTIQDLCLEKPVLAVCDPPYGIGIEEWDVFPSLDDYLDFTRVWISNLLKVMDTGALYIWLTQKDQMVYHVWNALRHSKDLEFRREIILEMDKVNAEKSNWPITEQRCLYYDVRGGIGFKRQETEMQKQVSFGKQISRKRIAGSTWNRFDVQPVWFKSEEKVEECNTALQKPVRGLRRIIRAHTEPGDIVIDLFAHSGSTLQACEEEGRVCYTMDIEEKYIQYSAARLLSVMEQPSLL